MDPNETLRRMRELAETMASGGWFTNANVVDLAEKFEALDSWLTRGGFLPNAWQRVLRAAYNAGRQAEATARYNAGQIGDDKPLPE